MSIAAGAIGLVALSSSAGFPQKLPDGTTGGGGGVVQTGMPLSAGRLMMPVHDRGRHGERLTYTFVVTQHGTMIQVSLNNKPLISVRKQGTSYSLSDPNGSGKPILILKAPTR